MVRAKFFVESVTYSHQGGAGIKMRPVYSSDPEHENKKFWDATPSGTFEMWLNKPEVTALFEVGKEYYLDFTRAE